MKHATVCLLAVGVLGFALPARAEEEKEGAKKTYIQCEMTFELSGWSAFYKTAKGTGSVTCDNGQSAPVEISIKGGGLTFGKTEIDNGSGSFSGVERIDEVFGSYAAAEAHGGATKSGMAQAMTKGPVSLALKGTGRGWDAGIAFSKFSIKKPGSSKKNKKEKKPDAQG